MHKAWALIGSLIVALAGGTPADATCSEPGGGRPSVKKEFRLSDYVLIGKVVSQKYDPDAANSDFFDGTRYRIKPVRIFKGRAAGTISVFSENSTDRFPMVFGTSYVLFLHRDHGRYVVDHCGNSVVDTQASRQLLMTVEKLVRPTTTTK